MSVVSPVLRHYTVCFIEHPFIHMSPSVVQWAGRLTDLGGVHVDCVHRRRPPVFPKGCSRSPPRSTTGSHFLFFWPLRTSARTSGRRAVGRDASGRRKLDQVGGPAVTPLCRGRLPENLDLCLKKGKTRFCMELEGNFGPVKEGQGSPFQKSDGVLQQFPSCDSFAVSP